jgi:formate-nitrite transporter family protein
MVILGRQQLFTENTITVVLPVMACFSLRNLGRLARMWGIVLAANLAGTLIAASFCTLAPVISVELRESMINLSRGILEHGWIELFFRGISAGFLMAAMVWLIPGAAAAEFYVIVLMTYLISVGNFAHVIAGSMEAFVLVLNGEAELRRIVQDFLVPVLLGNITGGTALFAVISHAQVMKEI